MADKDLHTKIFSATAFNTIIISSNGTYVGNIIDMFGFDSVSFVFMSGQTAGSDINTIVEHDDNSSFSTAVTVPSDYLIGSLPSYVSGEANVVKKIGYVGKKRYVRVKVIATNHTGAFGLCCIAIKGDANKEPTN